MRRPRKQLEDPKEIVAAIRFGAPLRLVLVRRGTADEAIASACDKAADAGVPVRLCSDNVLRRFSPSDPPSDILGLVGMPPDSSMEETMASEGAVWLLAGIKYPGNAGFAIRTAEVSGAEGVVVDNGFGPEDRRRALRLAMRAHLLMPVHWAGSLAAIEAARAAGRRIIAVEDVGTKAPWDVDLTQPALLVVGGERHGIPQEILDACDEIVRVPMAGFIPSYNVQAAMAAVASERLRQIDEVR